MTTRLVLLSAPVSIAERYGAFAAAASTEPSFALVCLAAVAQQAGSEITVIDASARGLTVTQALQETLRADPNVVGITATTAGIVAAAELAGDIKRNRPDTITVIGGCHATALPEQTLTEFPGFDLVALGEGEDTLCALLRHVQKEDRESLQSLPGLAARSDGRIRTNPRRPLIHDLDQLPLPAWSLLPGFPRAFRPSPARIKRWPCASVVFTRGCPNQCVFCDRSVFGHRCRGYSAERAVEIVKDLRDHFGVREILVEDDTFTASRARVTEFCERLIAERLDVSWSCLGRADRVDPEVLSFLRKAGCWQISYGIESGHPEILKAMKKNLDLERVRQAVAWSRAAGLRTKGFFIMGFPGENHDTLNATREFAKSLPLDDITVMQLTPFPGSELYAMAPRWGSFEPDWRKMNTLETVFIPDGLTKDDLESARARMIREFYMRWHVIFRMIGRLMGHPRAAWATVAGLRAFLRVTRQRPRTRTPP
jgi:radical SAM superfamily enzyme YgiQ (UPF0313 family)